VSARRATAPLDVRAIEALARKDIGVVVRTPAVLIPLVIVPAIVYVLLPIGMIVAARVGGPMIANELAELERLFAALPDALRTDLERMEPAARMITLTLGYLIAPLYLVVPLMVASVIAADAFAGEKERGTLEALLHAPLRERDLFLGKLLAAWLPAVAVGLLGTVLYAAIVTVAAWPLVGGAVLPAGVWIPLAIWVGPAVALAGLGATVLISARVATFQEAYQLGGVVVVPIVALVIAQAAGVVVLDARLLTLVGALVWLLDAVLLVVAFRGFSRERLAARL